MDPNQNQQDNEASGRVNQPVVGASSVSEGEVVSSVTPKVPMNAAPAGFAPESDSNPFPAGRIPEVAKHVVPTNTQPAMLSFLNPAAYKTISNVISSISSAMSVVKSSLPFGNKSNPSHTISESPVHVPASVQSPTSSVVSPIPDVPSQSTVPIPGGMTEPAHKSSIVKNTVQQQIVTPRTPHLAMQTPPMDPPLVEKADNKVGVIKKMFMVFGLLLILGAIGYGIFSFTQKEPGNGGNGNGSKGDVTPTVTPVLINTTQPSIYAADDVILQLEEDISALDSELSTTVLRESALNPPPLDYNISF